MKNLVFYEKPGCQGNARQKRILEENGFKLIVKSIFDKKWTQENLRPFFGDVNLKEWFNINAPAVRDHMIDFESLNETTALNLMIEDPILIRRPLMDFNGAKYCGFNEKILKSILGQWEHQDDMEKCQRINLENCSF